MTETLKAFELVSNWYRNYADQCYPSERGYFLDMADRLKWRKQQIAAEHVERQAAQKGEEAE